MSAVFRRLSAVLGFIGWVYSWMLIRGIRAEYSHGDIGKMPFWVVLLMGFTSTALIVAGLSAAMRAPIWPVICLVAGASLFLLVVGGQMAIMRSASPIQAPSISDALRAVYRINRSLRGALFVLGIPTVLVIGGIVGLGKSYIDGRAP
jgi:hypothetical protein